MKYLLNSLVIFLSVLFLSNSSVDQYICTPCGSSCDDIISNSQGTCSSCQMVLVKKSTVVFKKVEPVQVCSFLKTHKDAVLLDVRTKAEFEGTAEEKFGRLKNAINIPVQELEQRIAELEKYKNKEIIVYCSHSHRSPRASYMLTLHGFKKVTNMQGGMSVWKEQVTEKECNQKVFIKQ